MKAWAETEPFAFDGKYNQLRYVNCWPKPIQQPHPPIYIPGGGSIETWDFCLDHDYNYSYLSLRRVPRRQEAARRLLGAGRRDATRTTRRTAPRSRRSSPWPTPTPRPSGCTPSTSSTSSTAACTSTRASPIRPATARSRRSRPACSTSSAPRTCDVFQNLTWKDLVDGGYVIAGSPETVLDRMKDMITHAAPRSRVLPDAQRQPARLEDALLDASCSPRR